MIAQLRFESSAVWLVREDGWQFKLEGIHGIDYRWGDLDWGYGFRSAGLRGEQWVVTIPVIRSSEQLAVLTRTLQVLREELPAHVDLVIETND